MRTTLSLDDGLLRELKKYAAAHGETLSSALEGLLRDSLARRNAKVPSAAPPDLPVFDGRLLDGVDLDDSAALLDRMEASGERERR